MRRSRRSLWLALPFVAHAAVAPAADVTVTLDAGFGFSVRNSGGAVERLRVDEANGNVSRNGALFVHTTGSNNTFVGAGAGNPATSGGGFNSAFGQGALSALTTGVRNDAFGQATLAANTTGSRNSAFGSEALRSNTMGSYNAAFGAYTLRDNTTGYRNSAFGEAALFSNTTGSNNSAFGTLALLSNTTGSRNSGFGDAALYSNTTGIQNSAFGEAALRSNTMGDSNSAFGQGALYSNTTGGENSAFGDDALGANTEGYQNSAFGQDALASNTTGRENSAFGQDALRFNTEGIRNSAFGREALNSNTTGNSNSAFGTHALAKNSTGRLNSAFGRLALYNNQTGCCNVAIGETAGYFQTTGSYNIYIGSQGIPGESGTIRIGSFANHGETHIAGIHNSTSANGIGVLVNINGVLGTMTSTLRFKRDVRDMGEASDVLSRLRPVAFRYREEAAQGDDSEQYGLVAEEVAEVAPELVANDAEGKPYAVRYHLLAPMLLNEVQEQQRTIDAQTGDIAEQRALITRLSSRLESLEARIGEPRQPLRRR